MGTTLGEQDREYYRLSTTLPATVAFATGQWGEIELTAGLLLDVSGGGALVQIPSADLRAGDTVRLRFTLDEDRFQLKTAVLWTQTARTARQLRVGLRFEAISGADRKKIVRWVFAAQRRLLARGLQDAGKTR